MAITSEPYSVARRAIQNVDGVLSQQELERLIADIQEYLAGRGRVMVPHGFTVESVKNDTAVVRMPVIWEPRKDRIIARASDTPATRKWISCAACSGAGWIPASICPTPDSRIGTLSSRTGRGPAILTGRSESALAASHRGAWMGPAPSTLGLQSMSARPGGWRGCAWAW